MAIKRVVGTMVSAAVIAAGGPIAAQAAPAATETVATRIGDITLENGYPSAASLQKLVDEMDFQRAAQAYLWGLPIVGVTEWANSRATVAKVRNGQFELYLSFKEKLGILTPNYDTPYFIATADLSKTGPLVIEMPKGLIAGMVMDAWQRSLTDMGAVGPDKGQGGKFLIVGPGQDDPKMEGYYTFRSTTNTILFGGRLLDSDRDRAMRELVPGLRTYSYADRANPPKAQVVPAGDAKWSQVPPSGMAYWVTLAQALNNEPVQERDRFFMAMLKPLGIEKGKPFAPDAHQQKILADAAQAGELMAKANTYTKRFEPTYWPGSHWKDVLAVNTTQRDENFDQLDERASYFYEALAISEAMRSTTPGFGQRYMGVYQDKTGAWLTGANNYRLHVPANAPAKQFWSATVYDEKNRQMLINATGRMDVSSRNPAVKKNADGSTDFYVGPDAPKGLADNWVQTRPGESWFVLFRFYGPTEGLFDRSWVLPDFEKLK
nr:DUF1254 domain-containing protein [Polymorphobacter sp.]